MSASDLDQQLPTPASRLILLADDHIRTASRMAQMLRDDGFEVELAVSGTAAIERLARSPCPGALLTDFLAPDADGFRVVRYARARCAGMPILVITGYPHLAEVAAVGDPSLIVLTKPVDYAALSARLLEALRHDAPSPTRTS